jgi:hypothetical protein
LRRVACGGGDELFASTLFGYCRGAFSGAVGESQGALGEGSVVLVDEIGKATVRQQQCLHDLLNDLTYTRLGESTVRHFHGILVLAAWERIPDLVVTGSLSIDLAERLAQFRRVDVAPLRERPGEIEGWLRARNCPDASTWTDWIVSVGAPGNFRLLVALENRGVTRSWSRAEARTIAREFRELQDAVGSADTRTGAAPASQPVRPRREGADPALLGRALRALPNMEVLKEIDSRYRRGAVVARDLCTWLEHGPADVASVVHERGDDVIRLPCPGEHGVRLARLLGRSVPAAWERGDRFHRDGGGPDRFDPVRTGVGSRQSAVARPTSPSATTSMTSG